MGSAEELRIRISTVLERLYFICLVVISMMAFKDTTMFVDIVWSKWFVYFIRILTIIVVIGKIVFDSTWKRKEIIYAVLIGISLITSWAVSESSYVLELFLLILGAHNVSFRKIVKVYFYTTLLALLFTILMAFTGNIQNLIFYQGAGVLTNSLRTRMSFGFDYSAGFSAHILLLAFCYAWLRERDITFLEIFFFVLLGGFCKYFCDSRMSALCLLLLAAGLCVVKIRRMYDWITYEEDYVMNKGIQIILNISPVLCAAVIFILSFFYNPDFRWMSILNSVLSGRLALGRQGFDLYPVTLFGQKVEMNGFEGTTIEPESYFFLDSSYINILLCMGLLSLLCIIWILIRIIWIERQKMGWEHVIILGVLCIHSLAEHRLANIGYHPFLLLMFALPKVKCFCPEYFGIKSYLNSKIKGINYKRIICVILSICVFLSICIKGALILQDLSSSENSGREYLLREYDIPNDGSDCTEKLQNLIDDVYSNGGGSIIFDKGVYGIQSIELRSNVTLVGQGKENTVLKHLNGGTRENAFIYISDYIIGFSIEKMEIYGDKDNDKNVTNGIVFDVEATSKENTGDDEGKQVELRDLLIRDFSGDGCLISSGNSDIVLKNSEFRNNNMNGLEILSSDSTIENCIFAMSGQYGVINSGDNNSFSDIVCRENGILNHSSCGIYIYASDCTGNNIKSVGNHCNGICIMGDDNSFSDIVSESNGFIDEEGLTETASIWVEGNRNQVEGKCLKSDINQNPLNKYCVLMQNCSDCEIKIAADEKCSLNGLFVDQEQFIDFSK